MLLHLFTGGENMWNSCTYLGRMSNAENSAYLQVLTGMFPFLSKTKEKKSQSVGLEDHSTFGILIEGGDS